MEYISKKPYLKHEYRGFFSYFFKRMLSHSGDACGRILDAFLHDGQLAGFAVLSGARTYFIASEFVEKDTDSAVILSIEPVFMMIGKTVIDSNGKKIGRVSGLERSGGANDFKYLFVRSKFYRRPYAVDRTYIEVEGRSIVLKKPLEEVLRKGIV